MADILTERKLDQPVRSPADISLRTLLSLVHRPFGSEL